MADFVTIEAAEKSTYSMDTTQLQVVGEIAENESSNGYVQARQILELITGNQIPLIIEPIPGSNARLTKKQDEQKNSPVILNEKSLKLSPNPTSGNLNISFSFSGNETKNILVISNLLGVVVARIQMVGTSGTLNFDCSFLSPGLYIYKTEDISNAFFGKIVVSK